MDKGEIWVARFPLGGKGGMKTRPALLLTGLVGPVPEALTAYISSVIPNPLLPSDLLLDPARPEDASTNLKKLSVVRLHKLSTLHQRDIMRYLGRLSPQGAADVEARLRALLNL
jgi:mRNA-degrading endonuclease toxin of MazEF toxin-antitoxin module